MQTLSFAKRLHANQACEALRTRQVRQSVPSTLESFLESAGKIMLFM